MNCLAKCRVYASQLWANYISAYWMSILDSWARSVCDLVHPCDPTVLSAMVIVSCFAHTLHVHRFTSFDDYCRALTDTASER